MKPKMNGIAIRIRYTRYPDGRYEIWNDSWYDQRRQILSRDEFRQFTKWCVRFGIPMFLIEENDPSDQVIIGKRIDFIIEDEKGIEDTILISDPNIPAKPPEDSIHSMANKEEFEMARRKHQEAAAIYSLILQHDSKFLYAMARGAASYGWPRLATQLQTAAAFKSERERIELDDILGVF